MYQFKSKFKQFLLSRRLITYIWQYACVNAAEQNMTILFAYVMLDQESPFFSNLFSRVVISYVKTVFMSVKLREWASPVISFY